MGQRFSGGTYADIDQEEEISSGSMDGRYSRTIIDIWGRGY
jgi:hypothetical protein